MHSLTSPMMFSEVILIRAFIFLMLLVFAVSISTLISKLLKAMMLSELKKTRGFKRIPLKHQAKSLRVFVFGPSLIVGLTCFWLMKRPLFSLFGLILGPLVFRLWVWRSRHSRSLSFDQEMLHLLVTITGMVRAGLSLDSAIEIAAARKNTQLSGHMARYLVRFKSGLSFQEVLGSFGERSELKHSSRVVELLGKVGAKGVGIANLLEDLTSSLKESLDMEQRIGGLRRSITMQGAFASFLPWGTLGVLWGLQSELLKPFLYSRTGTAIICFCIFFQFIGGFVLWQVSRFR